MYNLCNENKDTDQLCKVCAFVLHMQKADFLMMRLKCYVYIYTCYTNRRKVFGTLQFCCMHWEHYNGYKGMFQNFEDTFGDFKITVNLNGDNDQNLCSLYIIADRFQMHVISRQK